MALSYGRMHIDVCLQACCQIMVVEKQTVKVEPVVKGLQNLITAAEDEQNTARRAATGAWMVLCALQPHDVAAADWEFLASQWKSAVQRVCSNNTNTSVVSRAAQLHTTSIREGLV